MKKHLFPLGIFTLLFAFTAFSQTPPPVPKTPENPSANKTDVKVDEENSDLVITAIVHARELKFEIVPTPKVEFPGTPERQTVWESDRANLPEKVEPGVIYRDIGIRLRIYSRFAEIQRIVLEAIDEEPQPVAENQVAPSANPPEKAAVPPSSQTRSAKSVKRALRSPRK